MMKEMMFKRTCAKRRPLVKYKTRYREGSEETGVTLTSGDAEITFHDPRTRVSLCLRYLVFRTQYNPYRYEFRNWTVRRIFYLFAYSAHRDTFKIKPVPRAGKPLDQTYSSAD